MASGITTKIWLASVLYNTVFLTAFLGINGSEINMENIGSIFRVVMVLFVLNLVFSLPAFFLFWIVMQRCSLKDLKRSQLYSVVITTALALTAATYIGLLLMFNLWDSHFLPILYLSLVSVLLGIAVQWRALRKLSIDKQTIGHEN